jgi:hypothetical protein
MKSIHPTSTHTQPQHSYLNAPHSKHLKQRYIVIIPQIQYKHTPTGTSLHIPRNSEAEQAEGQETEEEGGNT